MTINELKIELATILSYEEEQDVDWINIEYLSERTYVRLTEPDTPQDFPHEAVIGYLAGFQRRRHDREFAAQQRRWLMAYLRSPLEL